MRLKDLVNTLQNNIHVVICDWNNNFNDVECVAKNIPAEFFGEVVRFIQIEENILYVYIEVD